MRTEISYIAKKYDSDVDLIVEANLEKYKSISRNYIVCGWHLIIPKKEKQDEYSDAVSGLCAVGVADMELIESIGCEATVIALWRMLKLVSENI